MRYVSAKDVLVMHARIVEKTGGSQGVRDVDLLESAVAAPRQTFDDKDLHQGVFVKAAVLLQKLVNNHPFVDGNKRTAFAATARFLFLNGYILKVDKTTTVNFMVRVAEESVGVNEIADWLEKNSKRKT